MQITLTYVSQSPFPSLTFQRSKASTQVPRFKLPVHNNPNHNDLRSLYNYKKCIKWGYFIQVYIIYKFCTICVIKIVCVWFYIISSSHISLAVFSSGPANLDFWEETELASSNKVKAQKTIFWINKTIYVN